MPSQDMLEKAANLTVFNRDNVRFSCIGDSSKLPDQLKELINYAEEKTEHNAGLKLTNMTLCKHAKAFL